MQVELVRTKDRGSYWIDIEQYIDQSEPMWERLYTKKFLYESILDGGMQLWLVLDDEREIKSIILTQIVSYPKQKILEVVLAAGEELIANIDCVLVIGEFATACGVNFAMVKGRYGWKKPLSKLGFEMYNVNFFAATSGVE